MFNQIRDRFLLVNLVIISVMMLLSFASIYMITYQNVHHDIDMELHKISDFYRKHNDDPGPPLPDRDPQQSPEDKKAPHPPERSGSFLLQTDKQGEITDVTSRFEMDREFYHPAVDEVLSQNRSIGQVNVNGNHWAYTVQETFDGYQLIFLDITAQQGILANLVYTFILVGSVMLIVIFFISRFFANRSIAPVKEAFEKQKQFIADASHELKTPLAIINTNADVLLSNPEDTIHKQAKWLHYIKSETERMAKLTNDLLYLTEMDDSRARMIFTEFNVSEVVKGCHLNDGSHNL
ncbi:histidine kinase dimerization/phospho-acceptor domain-containing protein [Ammoniphilus sp. 3BR4]|uniref:histidine kinase dimerization/phospho-acceptor domain-containing protein n=1 Tax=Ammoniphilus sp. 3BR4 TaxID=3158265 RepID=UPI0034654EEC